MVSYFISISGFYPPGQNWHFILISRTYEVPTYSFSYTRYEEINKVGTKKIYNIEVIIDGETRAERWGTDIDEMNNQYKILKANCEG